jgi:hypothetical protein
MVKGMQRYVAGASLILLVAGGVALASAASAQTAGLQIKIQPALFEQVVNPGDRFSTSITVTNPQKVASQFTIGVQDIVSIDRSGKPVFSSSSVPEYGLSSWVFVPNPTITIPAGGSVAVPFTITVPRTAAPGGHYGAIFANYGATKPSFSNGAGIGYQVGALIDLRIAGDAKEQAAVTEFSADRGLYQSADVTFTATVADQGNVLLRPRGPVDVTNMFGQKVGEVVMNAGNEAIFPGTQRSFAVHWVGGGFMMGQFNAVMALSYGDTGAKTTSASLSFWVVPVVPIVAVLLSIVFFILIFVWSVRVYVRKRVSAMASGGRRDARSMSEEERILDSSWLPFSRLLFIVAATVVFALVFLMVLFLLFG